MSMFCAGLAVHFSHHEIQTAQHRNDIAYLIAAHQLRQDLQVHKGWSTQLSAPGILTAIADKVDAQLALAALDSKVGFAAWWAQGHRCACTDRACRQFTDRYAAEANTLLNFLHAHSVACVAIAFLSHLDPHRHFAVCHGGAIDTQVPAD